ncbi:hypothetical protein [Enterobacter kobei]|uniref:hypothetical protein n=1 Tax=Enterobacter kobei TaxID=208224 RepID=UPI003CFAA4FA
MGHKKRTVVCFTICLLWGAYAGNQSAVMRTWPELSAVSVGQQNIGRPLKTSRQQVLQRANQEKIVIRQDASEPAALESVGAVSVTAFNQFLGSLYGDGLVPHDIQIRATGENEQVKFAKLKFE